MPYQPPPPLQFGPPPQAQPSIQDMGRQGLMAALQQQKQQAGQPGLLQRYLNPPGPGAAPGGPGMLSRLFPQLAAQQASQAALAPPQMPAGAVGPNGQPTMPQMPLNLLGGLR